MKEVISCTPKLISHRSDGKDMYWSRAFTGLEKCSSKYYLLLSATPTSPDAWQPSDPSASGPIQYLLWVVLHNAVVSARVSAAVVRCLLDHHLMKSSQKQILCHQQKPQWMELELSSCVSYTQEPDSFHPNHSFSSSCTQPPLEPSPYHLPLAQNTNPVQVPQQMQSLLNWSGSICWSIQISL